MDFQLAALRILNNEFKETDIEQYKFDINELGPVASKEYKDKEIIIATLSISEFYGDEEIPTYQVAYSMPKVSLLHVAVFAKNEHAITILLNNGANPSIKGRVKEITKMYSICTEKHEEIIKFPKIDAIALAERICIEKKPILNLLKTNVLSAKLVKSETISSRTLTTPMLPALNTAFSGAGLFLTQGKAADWHRSAETLSTSSMDHTSEYTDSPAATAKSRSGRMSLMALSESRSFSVSHEVMEKTEIKSDFGR